MGRGVQKDGKEAEKWFRLAVEQEDFRAQSILGTMYTLGQGVPINYKEAAKWYRRAANQGHARAQFFLGGMYYKGDGVTQVVIQELI